MILTTPSITTTVSQFRSRPVPLSDRKGLTRKGPGTDLRGSGGMYTPEEPLVEGRQTHGVGVGETGGNTTEQRTGMGIGVDYNCDAVEVLQSEDRSK